MKLSKDHTGIYLFCYAIHKCSNLKNWHYFTVAFFSLISELAIIYEAVKETMV